MSAEILIIDDNADIRSLLRDLKSGAINTLDKLFNRFSETKFVKTATRLYAGGDSGWKISVSGKWQGADHGGRENRGIRARRRQ